MESYATTKSDMKSALCDLCLRVKDFCLLLLKAKSPADKKTYFFFDKCFPSDSSNSCALFQEFSDAVAFLVTSRVDKVVVNYS